ncbi:glycerophosphodiester phosphodiesterase [Georgenia halophila]|uniref:Glycerophosphodiester phosphodiesterase n=1 Tax=Georgenia halophila TaxID=620889 RepID=A0ABP8L192_9MICO
MTGRPLVIAHRGSSAIAPENTMPALVAAALAGADMIEIDVQISADGGGVVVHDDTVDRTTDGSGRVADLGSDEVRHLDAGSWFEPVYARTTMPLFGEVVELLVRYPNLELLLELKGAWPAEPARALLATIRDAGIGGRVLAQSASVDTMATVRELAPELRRGLLVSRFTAEMLDVCTELGVTACNPHGRLLVDHPELVDTLHGWDMQVMVWTLNEAAHWAAATVAGVDGIITDRPDRLLGWLDAQELPPPA